MTLKNEHQVLVLKRYRMQLIDTNHCYIKSKTINSQERIEQLIYKRKMFD